MDAPTYRSPARPRPPASTAPDEAARLGALRSTHRPPPLRRALVLTAVVSVAPISFAVLHRGPYDAPIVIGVLALLWGVSFAFRWPLRGARVDLHADGLVVQTARGRDVVLFDDVDTLWFDLDHGSSSFGKFARLIALRLVDHDGKKHRVPLGLDGWDIVLNWILRHCSDSLVADAEEALRAGDGLTFGDVQLDNVGIRFGTGERIAWTTIRLARFQPGSVSLFRSMPLFPWRTIRLDRVPHPTLFARLLRGLAPKVEVDDPLAKRRV